MSATSSVMNLLKEFPNLISLHGKTFGARTEGFRFEGLEGGIPKGALVEVSGSSGSGKTEVILRFLAQNPSARVAWVEEDFSIYPNAFPQSRVGLERVLFVDVPPGSDPLWTAHQMIRSGVFGVIVLKVGPGAEAHGRAESRASARVSPVAAQDGAAGTAVNEMSLRRLQLAAEKAGVTVVLLSDQPAKRGTWPISVQLQAHRSIENRAILLNVLKYRGQKSWQLSIG